jgi:hypothetical protein
LFRSKKLRGSRANVVEKKERLASDTKERIFYGDPESPSVRLWCSRYGVVSRIVHVKPEAGEEGGKL